MPASGKETSVNETYHVGLLVLVFGGFVSLHGTGGSGSIGIAVMLIGLLIGVIGLLQSLLEDG